jgi:hypothetical protein
MSRETTLKNQAPGQADEYATVIPYRMWWGLLGCALFIGAIFAFAPYSEGIVFEPDRGDMWYFWQLSDATVWTRLSVWIPYCIHQVAIWYLIAGARDERPRYIFGLHRFNVWALGINAFFIFLHILQTKLFYDGLAQDVPEWSALGSVTIMLFLVLLMENGRRGLFFGYKIRPMFSVGQTLRQYHGYFFAWAIIYTFWYHPVEMTAGHIAGFIYMSLLLLQSSLFFTRYHTNRWWTMFLEVSFVIHGALVAFYIMNTGQHAFWSMFLFGGVLVFLVTQLHGLGLSRPKRWVLAAPFLAALAIWYGSNPDYLSVLWRVPAILYVGTFICFGLIWVGMQSLRLVRKA